MPPQSTNAQPPRVQENKRALWSWAFYDWANSAFFTIILTFVFAQYFSVSVMQNEVKGTEAWGYIVGISGVIIAVLAPILGAIADQSGRRKPWFITFTLLCVVSCAMLWTITPDQSQFWNAALWVGLGTLGAEFAFIFYNSMLPDLASEKRTGRWSGWAWGLGYVGGVLSLVVALYGFIETDANLFNLNRDEAEHVRATFVLVAVWYLVFALPAFVFIPDRPSTGLGLAAATRAGFAQLKESIAHVRQYKDIVRFLIARMLYTDGLATIFTFGGVYAAGTFNMSSTEVLQFAIALNVTAGLGALGFAWVDDALGGRNTILLSLAGLGTSALGILLVDGTTAFWVWGMILGIFVGPLQSASRSHLARVAPPHLQTQMFGLFAFSGKATAFAGPLLVGWVTAVTDSQRWGMSTILVFLVVGFVLMLSVPVTETRQSEYGSQPQ